MWSAFKIAFSMYSKIPMPKTDWNDKNMKYAMCFFPMVGAAIGLIVWAAYIVSYKLQIGDILRTSILTVLPVLITGGIHLDGFVDTMDAINSYQPVERKLEILKDSHIGAFALIYCVVYFIIDFGIWSEVGGKGLIILCIGFVMSRAFSALSIVTFPCAKKSGLAASFSDAAQKNAVRLTMYVYIFICSIAMLYIDIILGAVCIITSLIMFIYYKYMSIKNFSGITGDLAGYFLQMCELLMAVSIVVVEKIIMIL